MKTIVLLTLFFTTFTSFSQDATETKFKNFRFGFNMGMQQSFLINRQDLPPNTEVDNALGYRLGILGKYQSPKNFFTQLRAELAVNHSSLMYPDTAGNKVRYDVCPTTIQTSLHLGYAFEKMGLKPFVYGGANFKYPFIQSIDQSSVFPSGQDLAVEFGVGIKRTFEYFDLIPEIRYSHGLQNVNRTPMFPSIYVNELSFSLIFM